MAGSCGCRRIIERERRDVLRRNGVIEQLKKLFAGEPVARGLLEHREPLELVTAALLLELSRADFSESAAEHAAIRELMARRFKLSPEATDKLIREAVQRVDLAVSLHEFTHRLNLELPEAGQAHNRRDVVARQSCRWAHRQARGAARAADRRTAAHFRSRSRASEAQDSRAGLGRRLSGSGQNRDSQLPTGESGSAVLFQQSPELRSGVMLRGQGNGVSECR